MENKSKHTRLGLALGAALGAVAGVLAGNMGVWLAIGVAIGIVLGTAFQRKEPACPRCAAMHRLHQEKAEC